MSDFVKKLVARASKSNLREQQQGAANSSGPSGTAPPRNPSGGGPSKVSRVLGEDAIEQVRGRRAESEERARTPSLERQQRAFRQSQFVPPPAWPPVQRVPARGVALEQGQLARMQDPVYAAGIDEARRAQERPTSFIRRSSPAPGQQTTNFSYPIRRRTSASPAPAVRRTSVSPGPAPRTPSPSKRG